MADNIALYVDERELGRPERRISVRGKLDVGEKTRARAALVLTPRGVFLVAAAGPQRGIAIDLLERPDLRWESGPLGDALLLGELRLGLAPGRAAAARELIGLGRLRRGVTRPEPDLLELSHVEAPNPLERAFLARYLEADEVLLAWLRSPTRLAVHSDLLGESEGEIRFFVSERRRALIALSEVGDVREVSLGSAPLVIERSLGRARLTCEGQSWQSTLGNADRYHQLASLLSEQGTLRLREAARLNFAARTIDPRFLASAGRVLEQAHERGDALAGWAALFLRAHGEAASFDKRDLEPLLAAPLAADAPAKLWEAWGFHATAARRVLDGLRALGAAAEPWALDLHRSLHARPDATEKGPFDRARADIALAEHLLATGRAAETTSLLEARLREMPSEALEELLPPSDADLTRGAGGQSLTIRIHELLALARGEAQRPDAHSLAVLARLQPLLMPRLRALSEAAADDLAPRARHTLEMLQPNGLSAAATAEPETPRVIPLSEYSIERALCHPLVREGGALLGRLQALLAAVPVPDHGVLRDYCETLALERHPDAARALADAALALGVRDLHAYVSRGKMSVGLRAYEGTPPFILIGVRHLEGDAAYAMSAEELRFAIGAEVAHLRYGHTRVTSSEVWAGALSKSKQGIDFALGVLPMLKGWRFADKASRIISKLPVTAVRRALDGQGLIGGRLRSGIGLLPSPRADNEGVLSRINEELVAAHRVMQLTADRAGLLLAGDLCAAVRGLLLQRRDHRQVIEEAERDGLDKVLARRDPSGAIAHQDLAVRVAALIAFYLSDDYPELRTELSGGRERGYRLP